MKVQNIIAVHQCVSHGLWTIVEIANQVSFAVQTLATPNAVSGGAGYTEGFAARACSSTRKFIHPSKRI